MDDPYHLERFVAAQDTGGDYQRAVEEMRAGAKRGHWMWFVFPQIAGLGYSPTAQFYAIRGLDEAKAYLAHPVLGARLREASAALLPLPGADAVAVLGSIDALKLRSCMTLFHLADPQDETFPAVLAKYFGGVLDDATTQRV